MVIYCYLCLWKEAGLLYKYKKIIFTYKLKNINYLDYFKQKTAVLSKINIELESIILLTATVPASGSVGFNSSAN